MDSYRSKLYGGLNYIVIPKNYNIINNNPPKIIKGCDFYKGAVFFKNTFIYKKIDFNNLVEFEFYYILFLLNMLEFYKIFILINFLNY